MARGIQYAHESAYVRTKNVAIGCLRTKGISALYRIDGAIYATADMCTHGEASLSLEGLLTGKTVECTFHFGTFDVTTGEPTGMPCEIPLKTYPVTIVDGKVQIEV